MGEAFNQAFHGVHVFSPNSTDWKKRAPAVKEQRKLGWLACRAHCQQYVDFTQTKPRLVQAVDVHLTRISSKFLDAHDNLKYAFKPIVDGVADALYSRDDNPLIRWEYHQKKGQTGFELAVHGRRERVIDLVMRHDEGHIGFVRREAEKWCVIKLIDGVEHPLYRAPSLDVALAFATSEGLTGLWLDCAPTKLLL